MNKLFTLNKSDYVKGLITAVFASAFMTLSGIINQAGFDLFSADWGMILNDVLKVAVATFVGYIGKNFFSDSQGEFLGKADS